MVDLNFSLIYNQINQIAFKVLTVTTILTTKSS